MYRIQQYGLLAIIGCLTAIPQVSYAQGSPLQNGVIGAQVLGRVRILPDLSVRLYGYFTYVSGVQGSLFNSAPNENSAVLTFVAEPTAATFIANGSILQGQESPVNGQSTTLTVYYNPTSTGRNILNPDDFAQGQKVATFHSRAAAVTLTGSGSFQATGGLTLDTSSFFIINGQPVSIGNLTSALNLMLFGPAPTLDSIAASLLSDGSVSIPLSGTAYTAPVQN
jgi:hypothetical protein